LIFHKREVFLPAQNAGWSIKYIHDAGELDDQDKEQRSIVNVHFWTRLF
jgi:hypothetical protein